jgi:hypothetical protein
MAGTTRLELATSAVTVQRPEVISCNFTAPIATSGALSNPQEVLLHPYCTQILSQQDWHAHQRVRLRRGALTGRNGRLNHCALHLHAYNGLCNRCAPECNGV